MNFSAEMSSSRLSEKLNAASIKDLSAIILKTEDPIVSQEILPPLMGLLVGGSLDLKENFKIREPQIIPLLFELLPHCSESLQLEIWSTLTALLHQSLSNIQACRHLKLIERCLEQLQKTTSDRVANHVVKMVEILGGYSISVKELQGILSYLYTGQTEAWAPHSTVLLDALSNLSLNTQPDVFFSFSGAPGAVLTLPPLTKWPTQSGFTFSTWIRIEKPDDAQRDFYRPAVYWFRTGRSEVGYSAHLIGGSLVIETVSKGKKPQTHKVKFNFQSYQWYMVTVAYIHNRMKSCQLRCYVNSQPVLSADVTLPSTNDVFDKCFLGSTPTATVDVVFQGQMAAIYLFKAPLERDVVAALHKLGPGYKSQFNFDAETDVSLTTEEKKILFDGRLTTSVLFSYNAKAVDGQLCLEASPNDNRSYFAHSPHATLLEGVSPVKTTTFHNILHTLGGVEALIPLLSQLDLSQDTSKVDYSLSVKVLSLIFELTRTSSSFLSQLVQSNAVELLGYLLEKVSPQHCSHDLLSCVFDFTSYLTNAPNGGDLLCQLIEHLLFNPALWIRAHEKVQIQLYSRLATDFSIQPLGRTGLYLRDLVGSKQLLFILREYYSLVAEEGEKSEEHGRVRPYLLLIMKDYLTKTKGIQREDMRGILDYLISVPNEENLHDVLGLLLALVFEDSHHPGNIVQMFYDEGGINVAAKLLACTSEELTLNALKLIGMVLHHSPAKEVQYLVSTVELLAVLREKLLSAGQPVTVAMFNTLFEVLVDCPTRRIIDGHYVALDLSYQIKFPRMLAVMIELVCSLHASSDNWEERDSVMRVQLFSYVLSLCSQNQQNCKAILRLYHWQHWFLILADQPGAKQSDQASLEEMVYRLFHLMLVYSFKEELDGWRLWVETAAAVHVHLMSKTEETEEVTESLTDFHSNPAVVVDSGSIPVTMLSDSTRPMSTFESELESAESSTISLTTDLQDSSLTQLSIEETSASPATPTSPLTQEIQGTNNAMETSPSSSSPTLSRSPSTPSPFFIPKNPFLDLVGKVTKFKWSSAHISMLEELLAALFDILKKMKKSTLERQNFPLSDFGTKSFHSNVIHLLGLTVDSVIALNGGLRHLLAQSSSPSLATSRKGDSLSRGRSHSLKRSLSMSSTGALEASKLKNVLRLTLQLTEAVVFSGVLKLSPIETKLRMESGGAIRQGMRLVLASASLSTIQSNMEFKGIYVHYYEDKQTGAVLFKEAVETLQSLGLKDSSLIKYFELSRDRKFKDLRRRQQLLSPAIVTHLQNLLPTDRDNKPLLQQIVICLVYYLSTMCVTRYRSILSSQGVDMSKEAVASLSEGEEGNSALSDSKHTAMSSLDAAPNGSMEGSVTSSSLASNRDQDVEDSLLPSSVTPQSNSLDVSEQVEASMEVVGPFLCRLLTEYKPLLSKVLVGADGRVLISDAILRLARNKSILEMTMLLCSQEWQTALQKIGGKVFGDLLTEGKRVAKFSENYLRTIGSKTTASLERTVNVQTEKFTEFEEKLSLFLSQTIKSANKEMNLKRADGIRHRVSAKELWRKISSVVDDKGYFNFTPLRNVTFWKLDLRENSLRQHLQLLGNQNGSPHKDAVRMVAHNATSGEEVASTISLPSMVSPQGSHLNLEETPFPSEDLLDNLLYPDEQVLQLLSMQCAKVMLTFAVPGTLVITKSSIAFTADDSTSEYDSAQSVDCYCTLNSRKELEDITAILSRRYLHQNKALEVFFTDRTSMFLVFENSKEMGDVVRSLPKVGAGPHLDLPQARSISLAAPQQLFRKSTMTARWERREISNFEYLMFLNTIAGRSYNDLNQYPVFPWILKDYSSQSLDLSDPNVFRDLTKPVGALNPSRLEQFEERFNSFEDDSLPPFYYGTHYSTMAFILHWLVRIEPFCTLHIKFHDGLFDQSSRLFSCLEESWYNCTHSTSDVNELIPEFFYLPEMLQNENKFNFGQSGPCGDGDVIDNVKLPPWAPSAHEFVHMHREALESEYVSSNLHHWIDLIFGYKQRGTEAIKAKNLFYYLTYTGSINLGAVEDQALRKGLEDQIRNFGQTPVQLLNEPHPPRQELSRSSAPQPVQGLNPKDPALLAELQVTPDVPIALVQLSLVRNDLLVVSCNQLYAVNKWLVNGGTSKSLVPTVAIEPDKQIASGLRTRLGDPLDQSVTNPGACFTALPNCNIIIVCGFWDNSFRCFDTTTGSMIQSVFGHRHIVSCVDFSAEEGLHAHTGTGLISTGSHDATVLLWRWSGKINRVVGSLSQSYGESLAPVCVCTGHRQPVLCVSLSWTLGIVISGAKYGNTLVHSTSGELLHNLSPSSQLKHPHLIRLTRNGHFVVHYADQKGCLTVFTCNGKLLSRLSLEGPALAIAMTEDGRHLVSGGFDCTVRVFSTHNLQLRHTHPPFNSRIRSLHITKDQRFIFVGLASGSVCALSTHMWVNS